MNLGPAWLEDLATLIFIKLLAVWFLILVTNVMNDLKQSNSIQEMLLTGTYK